MPAPPPPPPPPMPGFGKAGPPPPAPAPPPIGSAVPTRPPPTVAKDRGALLTDITKGTRLKKAVTNDRSAPQIEGSKTSIPSAGQSMGAPAVPGLGKPPVGLAPPVPGGAVSNRARSNSDTSGGVETNGAPVAPQLGGIFAGVGMPKLKKTGGGVDTGASRDSNYASDPESSRPLVPKPPSSFAPKPPTAPKLNALRPRPQTSESSPPQPSNPLVANLRKAPPKPLPRLSSSADIIPPRVPPPLPGSLKPPPPPIASKKPSTAAPPPPPPPTTSTTLTPPSAPPPPPSGVPRPSSSGAPSAPPPPLSSAPWPPIRSTPPTPPNLPPPGSDPSQSLAVQAARNAFGNGPPSPAAPPPPRPPISSPLASRSSIPSPPPAPPSLPPPSQSSSKDKVETYQHSLSNGSGSLHANTLIDIQSPNRNRTLKIQDPRWRFQDESQLPKPREFAGFAKKYRAGRGSSVPLDLSQF